MMYWFKPKRYGWGAIPANWKGWLATFGFIAIIYAFLAGILAYRDELSIGAVIAWAVGFVVAELTFYLDCMEEDGRGLAVALGFQGHREVNIHA
jgi:hypothetical protein